MNDNPLISVVVPIYNGANFFEEAMNNIRDQGYAPLEIIVVDDGSTDEIRELIHSIATPEIRYLYQENQGPAIARNTGLRHASAEYITFLDIDDLWAPGKLTAHIQRFVADPELDVVIGRVQYIYMEGAIENGNRRVDPDIARAFVNLGAATFRRRVFDRIGMFDESLRFSEDVDWYFRAMEQDARMLIIKDIALLYRLHTTNVTFLEGESKMKFHFLRAAKRSIDRRRQPDGTVKPLPDWSTYYEPGYEKELNW